MSFTATQQPISVHTEVTTPSTRIVLPTNCSGVACKSLTRVGFTTVTGAPDFVPWAAVTPDHAIATRTNGRAIPITRCIQTSWKSYEPNGPACPEARVQS